ncbi:hypothetical protein [Actinomadura sp. K4S16]|uniref:hypothetical protein n=1 Tax=Actinomadura sp. K4S16 TaxID=1316147 RepID=UPI001357D946|nr:hypothetical protein [Actinomadura sp. K4S16]
MDEDYRTCELCGERIKTDAHGFPIEEAGEFTKGDDSVIAHAQCGLDAGLELA